MGEHETQLPISAKYTKKSCVPKDAARSGFTLTHLHRKGTEIHFVNKRASIPAFSGAICFVAWASILLSFAQAATIERVRRAECSFRLKGRIVAGDAAAFKKISGDGMGPICLDSEGGDLKEALAIIDLINVVGNQPIKTVIDRNEACRSECALIFMAGRRTEFHAITFPSRRLHVAGTLDFFPPSLSPIGSTSSEAVIAAAYADSVASMSQILAREHEHGDPMGQAPIDRNRTFPLSLLLAVLASGPGQSIRAATIEQAGRWGIEPFGMAPIEATDTVLLQACKNQSRWGGYLQGAADEIKHENLRMVTRDLLKVSLRRAGADDFVVCMASRHRDPKSAFVIEVSLRRKGESDTVPNAAVAAKEGYDTPLWSGLPPGTKLDSLRPK